MKYGLSISDQISHFLFAVGFGFIIGIFFRIVSAVRRTISSKKSAYIIQDLLFSVVTTVLCFFFMLIYSDGEIRLDLITAVAVGSAIYFLTVDKLVKSIVEPIADLIKKFIQLLFKPVVMSGLLLKKLGRKIKSSSKKAKDKLKKSRKKEKAENEESKFKEKKSKKTGSKKDKRKTNKVRKNKNAKKLNKLS